MNYFKISWRNILRNKSFSAINILGLAIGMACTIFIMLWVQHETSWDKFHPNHRNLYQLLVNRNFNGEITTDFSTPFPAASALKENFSEITASSLDDYGRDDVLRYGDKIIKKRIVTASPSYMDVFKWQLLQGQRDQLFAHPSNIVITQSTATALFGQDNAIGKVISVSKDNSATVSGVVADVPANSSIRFDALLAFNASDPQVQQAMNDWVNSFTSTFVEVNDKADVAALNKKLSQFLNKKNNNSTFEYFLYPVDKLHLYSDFKNGLNTGGMIDYVRLFSIIAVIILLIACVNFMNLSTAKSERRAKEVGIRKTLGSHRNQLVKQFYTESLVYSMVAYCIALLMVILLLPLFNKMIDKQLVFTFTDPLFLAVSLCIILITTFVAGSYPALYLSAFNPINVLKGNFVGGKSNALPRKVLVVFQFSISVLLISSTLLVYQQIQFVKGRSIGYDPYNLVTIPSSADANKNADVIKNELAQTNLVAAVTRTSSPITNIWNFTPAPDWPGKPADSKMIVSAMRADVDFLKTIGAKLLEGREFTNAAADSNVMLLNKAAVEAMQLKEPVGTIMRRLNKDYTVIGVTDNIVMASPFTPVMPMIIMPDKKYGGFFQMRLRNSVNPHDAMPVIESIFKKYNPGYPFDYSFVDEQYNRKFVTEDLVGKLANVFAGLAIFICCLGLSGLAAYTVEKRFKEIGIRKVLGASVQNILYLVSKEFLLLVGIAVIISIPISWYVLNNWLQDYEYRVDVSVWLFVLSCGSVMLLTLAVVWLNSLKAATTSPTKNLRTE